MVMIKSNVWRILAFIVVSFVMCEGTSSCQEVAFKKEKFCRHEKRCAATQNNVSLSLFVKSIFDRGEIFISSGTAMEFDKNFGKKYCYIFTIFLAL